MPKPKQFYWKLEDLWKKYYCNNTLFSHKTFDFTPSEDPVFFDAERPYFGLKNDAQILEEEFQTEKENRRKIFLTDNHHKILQFLFQYCIEQKEPIVLVHIDAHRDNAIFQKYEECREEIALLQSYIDNVCNNTIDTCSEYGKALFEDMKKHMLYIQNACRVSDYLDIAFHLGLIRKVVSLTQEHEFKDFLLFSENDLPQYILNLDIDIYGLEGSVVGIDIKTHVIAKAWLGANAVCIATSPGFIERNLAKRCIEIMTGNILRV